MFWRVLNKGVKELSDQINILNDPSEACGEFSKGRWGESKEMGRGACMHGSIIDMIFSSIKIIPSTESPQ